MLDIERCKVEDKELCRKRHLKVNRNLGNNSRYKNARGDLDRILQAKIRVNRNLGNYSGHRDAKWKRKIDL